MLCDHQSSAWCHRRVGAELLKQRAAVPPVAEKLQESLDRHMRAWVQFLLLSLITSFAIDSRGLPRWMPYACAVFAHEPPLHLGDSASFLPPDEITSGGEREAGGVQFDPP
ncbi:hypothetical protein ARMGADRAFT_224845 [Armillaria gallica]|uniref:Uncharacterized protein n=1 Tax=Armillaria gallica TaxID=47427 RepID=A0A2H3EPE0_ARMGA|nr:hypothetical protein ARMGADRAFT_224845 [Armillaria gallica]